MKKTVTRCLLVFFSLIILLTAATVNVSAANSTSRKSQVFSYLTGLLGLNNAAACGIMANIEQESGFDPTLVIRDRNGLLSGGLCQWNGGRFSNLIQYCKSNDLSYLSIPGQLSYLKYELQKQGFTHIYKYLKNVSNSAEGAYNAAYYWCYYFEIPSNRAARATSRANASVSKYWPSYKNSTVSIGSAKAKSSQNQKTLGFDDTFTLQWNKLDNVTNYLVRIAKKTAGGYDWTHADTRTVLAQQTSLSLPLKAFKAGAYAVRVAGQNKTLNKTGKSANTLSFTLKCPKHVYALATAAEPTFHTAGSYVYVCSLCGAKKTVSQPRLSAETFATQQVKSLAADSTDTTVTLTWQRLPGAAGYRIYRLVNNNWTLLKTLRGADATTAALQKLTPATRCQFLVRAFAADSAKTYRSAGAEKTVYTRPTATKLTIAKNQNGIIRLSWSAVRGADGYTLLQQKADGQWMVVADCAASKTAYAVQSEKAGTAYAFTVRPYLLTGAQKKIHAADSNTVTCVAK